MYKKIISILIAFLMLSSFTFAQGKWGLQVNAGAFMPSGDMGDSYNTGFGGTAGVTYNLNDNFQLGLFSGYMKWSFNESFITDKFPDYNVSVDLPFTIIPVMIGAKYFFTNSNIKPYANLNLGVHFASLEANEITFNGATQKIGQSVSKTEKGWTIGAGVLIKAGKKLNVDVNLAFNGTSTEFGQSSRGYQDGAYVEQSSSSSGTWLSIMAGIQYEL